MHSLIFVSEFFIIGLHDYISAGVIAVFILGIETDYKDINTL